MSIQHKKPPEQILRDFRRVRDKAPRGVGTLAAQFFKGNFRRQGFVDEGLERWEPREDPESSRAILVKTGRLRRSIRIVRHTRKSVDVGTNVPYGKYHNDGTEHLPQRQFIGPSQGLTTKISRYLIQRLQEILR